VWCPGNRSVLLGTLVLTLMLALCLPAGSQGLRPAERSFKGLRPLAEGVGFEPSEHLAMLNGFQVLRRSCYLVHLVLSSAVLSRVSCYLVRLVLSCVIWFWLQRVYNQSE
jgi:hypothetical protein